MGARFHSHIRRPDRVLTPGTKMRLPRHVELCSIVTRNVTGPELAGDLEDRRIHLPDASLAKLQSKLCEALKNQGLSPSALISAAIEHCWNFPLNWANSSPL